VYTFKHALTHEVAYQSLLHERRRVLHAGIVKAMEALAGERREEQVDRLAHHALRGEVWDQAVTYFRQAGTKARQRSANREAIECYEPALAALARLPESRDILEQALDLRLNLSGPLTLLLEFERNLNNLHTAETLAQTLGDQRRLVQVYGAMTNYVRMTGAPDRALAFAQRAPTLVAPLEDVGLQARVYQQLGQVYHTIGDYRRGMDVLGRSVATLQGALLYEDFGAANTASVSSLHWLNRCRAEVGAFIEGLAEADAALRVAEATNRPSSLAEVCQWVSILHLYKGEVHQAIPGLERALDLCQTWDLSLYFPTTASTLGYAYTLCGRLAEGMPLLE
jgi:tetratricopeptide (TPR) repeat protein